MKKASISMEELTCPSCIQKIEGGLKSLDGVDNESIKVLFNAGKVKLDFDEEKVAIENIEEAISKLGYEVYKSVVK